MKRANIKWYDYLACLWFADNIAIGILYFNIISLVFGILSYLLYEDFRKGMVNERK